MSPTQVILTGIAIALAAVGYYLMIQLRHGRDNSAELFESDWFSPKDIDQL